MHNNHYDPWENSGMLALFAILLICSLITGVIKLMAYIKIIFL